MRTSIGIPVIAALVIGGLSVSEPASAAPATPKVSNCGELSVKPTGIVLSCADANTALEKLTWKSWGASKARATGTFSENDCSPTCAAGMFHRYKAVVTLSDPKTVKGTKVFTIARVIFPGITDQSNRSFTIE